jgi:transcriptional regulator with XRE-family HTH domain
MTSKVKDLRLTVTVRNNQLQERREKLGLTARQLAERVGIAYGGYVKLENMSDSPLGHARGGNRRRPGLLEWRSVVKKLAAFYRVLPEDLFPDAILLIQKNRAEIRCDAEEIATALVPPSEAARTPLQLMESAQMLHCLETEISKLTEREQEVIRRRFGLDGEAETREEVSDMPNCYYPNQKITPGAVSALEGRALQKLRRSSALWTVSGPHRQS